MMLLAVNVIRGISLFQDVTCVYVVCTLTMCLEPLLEPQFDHAVLVSLSPEGVDEFKSSRDFVRKDATKLKTFKDFVQCNATIQTVGINGDLILRCQNKWHTIFLLTHLTADVINMQGQVAEPCTIVAMAMACVKPTST